ncbi:MAG TPA: helix-turn-helix domain-containing protein [Pyrinomonadaceae bacterium]|nr:helix-turn-helix domain-containing protein [Pyrinomonadaceae bacterium]
MSSTNLTTKEVARLLRVSEATIKRWADDGLLHSSKTAGGHRRFSTQSIANLRREQGIGTAPASPRPPKKGRALSRSSSVGFTELLLAGEEEAAAALLIHDYMEGESLVTLFDKTIAEAMHQVGERWSRGTITVADEHLATRVVLTAVQGLRGMIVPGEPSGMKAICCGIEGDLHELPVHLAEIILESEGWNTRNLGPNTPLFSLRKMVTHQRPQLVCISARNIADLDRAISEFAQLRRVTARLGAAVVLGGEGFRDPTTRQRFPCDFYAENFAGLAKFVRPLAKREA